MHAIPPLTSKDTAAWAWEPEHWVSDGVSNHSGICSGFAPHHNIYFKPVKVPSDGSWADFDQVLSQI